jgi:hypothetical protein
MFNLAEIVSGLAILAIVISLWAIYYFISAIIYTMRDRWEDERMQKQIDRRNKRHSPTVTKSPTVKKMSRK